MRDAPLFALFVFLVTVIGWAAWSIIGMSELDEVVEHCEAFGKFKHRGTVYECKKLEPAQ